MSDQPDIQTIDDELSKIIGAEAERIVNNVKHTHYQYEMIVDASNGTYLMDCSEFVSYVLEQTAPQHLVTIPRAAGVELPRAFEFYNYFHTIQSNNDGWHPIHRLANASRGDVIAWRIPGPIEPGKDTGHVFIVAERPMAQSEGIYRVFAYDSSDIPHNDDTRQTGVTGVGSGIISFQVDASGAPIAFQFKIGDSFHNYPVAIGRPEAFSDNN
jgi:hypothetical protein